MSLNASLPTNNTTTLAEYALLLRNTRAAINSLSSELSLVGAIVESEATVELATGTTSIDVGIGGTFADQSLELINLTAAGACSISSITGGRAGQIKTIYFLDTNITIINGTDISLKMTGNYSPKQYDSLTLINVGGDPENDEDGIWIELSISRSLTNNEKLALMGVTASYEELNILDGAEITTEQLNTLASFELPELGDLAVLDTVDWDTQITNIPTDFFQKNSDDITDITWVSTYLSEQLVASPYISGNAGYFTDQFKVGVDGIVIDGINKLIRSSNYVEATTGWQIEDDGTAEFNNVIIRGDFYIGNAAEVRADLNQTQVFYQYNEPTEGMVSGDLWIDSDDNKLYRYMSSTWQEVQDEGIATALANAATAQAAADAAQSDANDALADLADIANDSVVTPSEKAMVKQSWDIIVTEATLTTGTIPVQAAAFSVDDSDFDSAYAALNTYLNTTLGVFDNMTETTSITRSTWNSNWETYYDERTQLLNAIAAKAKEIADSKKTIFSQDSIPISNDVGDLWIDTDDNNTVYMAGCIGADQITAGEWEKAADITAENPQGLSWLSDSGTLTISTGKIQIAATGALEITSSGSLDIKSGGELSIESGGNISIESGGSIDISSGGNLSFAGGSDVLMIGSDSDPARIYFCQSNETKKAEIGIDAAGDNTYLIPVTDNDVNLFIGAAAQTFWYGTEVNRRFAEIRMMARTRAYVNSYIDSNNFAKLYVYTPSTTTSYGELKVSCGSYVAGVEANAQSDGTETVTIIGNVIASDSNVCRIEVGTYTGNGGTGTRVINADFAAQGVMLIDTNNDAMWIWVSGYDKVLKLESGAAISLSTNVNTIASNASGFQVNEFILDINSKTYYYLIWG